jgi:hypothetical protein
LREAVSFAISGLRAEMDSFGPLAVSREYDAADRLTHIGATNAAGVTHRQKACSLTACRATRLRRGSRA